MLNADSPKLQPVPDGLIQLRQFINYRVIDDEKLPCNVYGEIIDANDPRNWLSAQEAATSSHGLGFVIHSNDDIFAIDLDAAFDQTGNLTPLAYQVLQLFQGAAVEVSVSGKGLHIFGSGARAIGEKHRKRIEGLEFYTSGRFIALTGYQKTGTAAVDFSAVLPDFVERFGLTLPPDHNPMMPADDLPLPNYTGPAEDARLLDMMLNHKGGAGVMFGDKLHFRDLWNANSEALARHFPAGGNRPDGCAFDYSRADAALMTHLAFWTGKHPSRMVRLFQQSALYRPDKYTGRGAYRMGLIVNGGMKHSGGVYDRPRDTPETQLQEFSAGMSATDLLRLDIPPREFLVDTILPPGHYMLAAKPKMGKSFMALELAYSIATGKQFLRQEVQRGGVLYFALEEDRGLLQERLKSLDHQHFGNSQVSDLTIFTADDDIAGMDHGFLTNLENFLSRKPHTRLIVIDTFYKIRPAKRGGEELYAYDRRSADPLTRLCNKFPKLTILSIQHTRKMASDDPIDMISGSMGLTGACDGYFVLYKDAGNVLTLSGSGRRIKGFDYALSFTPPCWDLIGDRDEMPLTPIEQDVYDALVQFQEQATLMEIVRVIGKNKGQIYNVLENLVQKDKVNKYRQKYFALF